MLSKSHFASVIGLNGGSTIYKDPIFKLLSNQSEIDDLLNLPNFTKCLYLNAQKVHDVLYDSEEVINVDNKHKERDLSFYFYLFLLIIHNPDYVDYKYSFDFIKEINNKKKNNNNNYLSNIIISKIILALITNFEGFDECDDNKHQEEMRALVKENTETINKNINLIEDMNLNLTQKFIIDNKVDQIYIEIIIQLIKNDKLSDYEFSFNIISELNFEQIDLNEKMLIQLSNVLNSNDKNVEKYMIINYNDLLNNKIVNFHYILLKYILKSSVFIYQIPFLLKINKNIKKIINDNYYKLILQKPQNQEIDEERLEYVLEKYSDLFYYFKKYKKLDIIEDKINNNELEPWEKNKKDDLNHLNKEVYHNSTKSETNEIKRDEPEMVKYDPETDIQNRLFQYSIFIFHTNKKGMEPYIIIDKILIGKSKIEIKENVLNKLENSNKLNENYKSFLNFLNQIKNSIGNEFQYNYCLKIKLQFEIDEDEPLNEQSIYNISCHYIFYNPIDKSKKTFKDDNILINSTLNGFSYMIEEINDESFKLLEYEYEENNQKITKLENYAFFSNINQRQQREQNYNYSEYNDNSDYSSNNLSSQNENNNTTKPCTNNEYFNIEAEEEEILVPIKVINNIKDHPSNFFMELNNGDFISYTKNNILIVFDHKYNNHEIKNLDEQIYNISEKKSWSETEIIVCCVNNIYLINIKDNKLDSLKKVQISQMNCFLCYELKKDHYVISGETSTIYCIDIFTKKKKQKLQSSNCKTINNNVFRSGIKISDNIVALTSNSVMKNGQDNLSLYNIEKNETKKIFGYSYFYGTNGLSLMSIKGRKILLCACKKYYPEQKNGIVILDLSTINGENISERYFDTGNFEVNCFKPILDVKNKTMVKYGEENSQYTETEFFFAGGFDEEKGEAIIQLYKAYYDNEEDNIWIEYLQDIEFKSHKIFKGEGSITSIQQSKINGNILANSSDGNIYLFSKPNIQYYLEDLEMN